MRVNGYTFMVELTAEGNEEVEGRPADLGHVGPYLRALPSIASGLADI